MVDEMKIAALLGAEEVRIRSLIADLETGGVVSHAGSHEHLKPPEDRTMDGGSELAERSIQLGLFEQLEGELREVDRARRELAEGTYGRCVICGANIGAERLLALPTTRYCIEDSIA